MICADSKDRDADELGCKDEIAPGTGPDGHTPALRELMDLVGRLAGEVRELLSCVERVAAERDARQVEPRHPLKRRPGNARGVEQAPRIPGASLRELERHAILQTLEHVGGSTSKAAKILQISPRKIQYRLSEYRTANSEQPPAPK